MKEKIERDDRRRVAMQRYHNVPQLYGRGWIKADKLLPEHAMVIGIIQEVVTAENKPKFFTHDVGDILFRKAFVHFNDLAKCWQEGYSGAWVDVIYWVALPKLPIKCRFKSKGFPLPPDVLQHARAERKKRSRKWILL